MDISKTGDLMAALRNMPVGTPFEIRVGKDTVKSAKLEMKDGTAVLVLKK